MKDEKYDLSKQVVTITILLLIAGKNYSEKGK